MIGHRCITLHVARALDDEWEVPKARGEELRKLDPEDDWREISDEKIEAFQGYFNFSDEEGWHFYLPAFMRNYLKNFPNHGYDAAYWACTEKKNLKRLSEKQMKCVDSFLELVYEYEYER